MINTSVLWICQKNKCTVSCTPYFTFNTSARRFVKLLCIRKWSLWCVGLQMMLLSSRAKQPMSFSVYLLATKTWTVPSLQNIFVVLSSLRSFFSSHQPFSCCSLLLPEPHVSSWSSSKEDLRYGQIKNWRKSCFWKRCCCRNFQAKNDKADERCDRWRRVTASYQMILCLINSLYSDSSNICT